MTEDRRQRTDDERQMAEERTKNIEHPTSPEGLRRGRQNAERRKEDRGQISELRISGQGGGLASIGQAGRMLTVRYSCKYESNPAK
ncbi:MAG: hypothetical protein ABSH16_06380 [Sedimentisphaerales bacterium]